MKRSMRSAAKRAGAPLLGPLDRRFADFTELQRKELERLDERLEIDLRIVDEHLLAIQRASRRIETAATPVHQAIAAEVAAALATDPPTMVIVAMPGQPLVAPEGFVAEVQAAFRGTTVDGWAPDPGIDDASTLRVARLRSRS